MLFRSVAPDGALYIADSYNACIRKVQNGTVSTVAGKCGDSRAVDGDAATGRLLLPLSLSFDKSGTLWIADYGAGLRSLAQGQLTTIKLKSYGDLQITSVSAQPEADGAVIAATQQLFFLYDRATKTDTYSVPFAARASPDGMMNCASSAGPSFMPADALPAIVVTAAGALCALAASGDVVTSAAPASHATRRIVTEPAAASR